MKSNITTVSNVKETNIRVMRINNEDYISLTYLAKYKNPEAPSDVINVALFGMTAKDWRD